MKRHCRITVPNSLEGRLHIPEAIFQQLGLDKHSNDNLILLEAYRDGQPVFDGVVAITSEREIVAKGRRVQELHEAAKPGQELDLILTR